MASTELSRTSLPKNTVGIGDCTVTDAATRLVAPGLGSCLGIAIHDTDGGQAALVHAQLPSAGNREVANPYRYTDTGIRTVIEELVSSGESRDRLTTKLAGGATICEVSHGNSSIGRRNIEQCTMTLEAQQIPIRGRAIGGDIGRTVRFDTETGCSLVESVEGTDQV